MLFSELARLSRPRALATVAVRYFSSNQPRSFTTNAGGSQQLKSLKALNWLVKLVGFIAVIGGSFVAGAKYYHESKPAVQTVAKDVNAKAVDVEQIPEKGIPEKLLGAMITSSEAGDNYIERPELEAKINKALDKDRKGYYVVYGPKGMGKSEIVDHCAIKKPAVVKLPVSSARTKEELVSSMMSELAIEGNNKLKINKLNIVLKACKEKGFTPVIIFEIEPDKEFLETALAAAKGLAKALVGNCRSILVLSEAITVLNFTQDTDREKFIFVGEMAHGEAKQLLKRLGSDLTDEQMEYVFNTIGTGSQLLTNLFETVNSGEMALEEFIDDILSRARQDLVGFPLKPILKALKLHPEGVSTESLNNQEYKGIDLSNPKAVGIAMKTENCILYRMELQQYQLQTTAHKTAIKTYDPIH